MVVAAAYQHEVGEIGLTAVWDVDHLMALAPLRPAVASRRPAVNVA